MVQGLATASGRQRRRRLPPSLSLVVHIFWLHSYVATGAIGVPDLGPAPQILEQNVADEITSTIDEEELWFLIFFERAGDSTGGCLRPHECLLCDFEQLYVGSSYP